MQHEPRTIGMTIDGYAVEGGYDTDDGPSTSFGAVQALGKVRRSLVSQRTFEHLPELVARIADLGVGEVRLTMEWARLEPRPDELDSDALECYDRALRAAERRGLSVVVVLCDAVWPSWMGQEPWLSTWAPVRFARHAGVIGSRLEGRLGAVVTLRVPNATARTGWVEGTTPPFRRRAAADGASALDGMLLGHQLAAEALAASAPTTARALLFEASWRYDDEPVFRDLALGVGAASSAESEERWRSLVATHPARARRTRAGRRPGVLAMRSTPRWPSTPPCEWWLASDDLALLGAALEHAGGSVGTIELSAGTHRWDEQLLVATNVSERARRMHLRGALASTGPLPAPRGLFDLDQHDGRWALSDPEPRVLDALSRLVR